MLEGAIDEQALMDGLHKAANQLLNRVEDEIITTIIEGKRVKITGTWFVELVDKEPQ